MPRLEGVALFHGERRAAQGGGFQREPAVEEEVERLLRVPGRGEDERVGRGEPARHRVHRGVDRVAEDRAILRGERRGGEKNEQDGCLEAPGGREHSRSRIPTLGGQGHAWSWEQPLLTPPRVRHASFSFCGGAPREYAALIGVERDITALFNHPPGG